MSKALWDEAEIELSIKGLLLGERGANAAEILDAIEKGGDAAALEYAAKFDKYDGEIILSDAEIEAASAKVPEKLKRDIEFSHANVKRFAEAQRDTHRDQELRRR